VGHLNQLQEKYFDKGLRVIGISSEPLSRIEAVMVTDHGAKFWMGSDPDRATLRPFGGGGIPHAYLVSAGGTIVWDGHPASLKDDQIETLLADVFDPKLDRELHKSLNSLVKQYEKGQYGKAWSGAAKHIESGDRDLTADATYLREKCDKAAAFYKGSVERAVKNKDFDGAYDDLQTIAKDFAGMDLASWAADTKKTLDADPAVKNERSAWKSYEKAQQRELKAGGKAKKLKPVVTAYKRIVKKYPGTRAAKMAEAAVSRLPR